MLNSLQKRINELEKKGISKMINEEKMMNRVEELYENTPDGGVIIDADTILKDLIDENDFEISGIAQDIFNIYRKSSDKQAVKEMFYEFTGVEFEEYLIKCINETTR